MFETMVRPDTLPEIIQLSDERFLTEVDHLNRFRESDGGHSAWALAGVRENLVPAVKEAAMPYAVSTTYQEYRGGTYWWLDQTPEGVAASGFRYHQHPAALERVKVEVEEAHDTAANLRPGFMKVFISPKMTAQDAPYEVAKNEHLADEDMIRIHIMDLDDDGSIKGKFMQSLLLREVPLSAWVNMLRDPENIFGKSVDISDEESALSVMEVHSQLELPVEALPEGVITLVESVLPYTDDDTSAKISAQLELFRCDQADLHSKAENIADRWLSFEVALADSLADKIANPEVEQFINQLSEQWDDEMRAELIYHTLPDGRLAMTRDLAAKLERSRRNTLWVPAAVITGNQDILKQLSPEAASQIYQNEMQVQAAMSQGRSAQWIGAIELRNNQLIAVQNVSAGGGCPGQVRGAFGDVKDNIDAFLGQYEQPKKEPETNCTEIKDGQKVRCPDCNKQVTAIVPNRETIYCSNPECKLAAPNLKQTSKSEQQTKPKLVKPHLGSGLLRLSENRQN